MPPPLKRFPFLSATLLAALLATLLSAGLGWPGLIALAIALLWFGFEFARWLAGPSRARRDAPEPEPEVGGELVSLVYFLSEPRTVDESAIRSCVEDALGLALEPSGEEAECFVVPFTPPDPPPGASAVEHFMIRVPQGLFTVLVSRRPYIDDPEAFASGTIRDKRLRRAVESHRAWLSVDWMEEDGNPARARLAYRTIGKLMAAMAGPDCLAVFCPELQRCNEFDLSLLETLSSEEPLSLFIEPTFEPVIEVAENDPRMAEAVEEARRRWPEFVEAFRGSGVSGDDRYIVKAEFCEGELSEYMWVTVSAVENGEIVGTLMNDPHELIEVHRGAPVRIPLDRLNDWIHPGEDGALVGGFTLDVLAEDGDPPQ